MPTIRLENLSPDQVRAYVLADNRLAEKAGWDESILAIELQHLLTIEVISISRSQASKFLKSIYCSPRTTNRIPDDFRVYGDFPSR